MTSPTNAITLYKQPVCIISQMSFCDQRVLLLLSSSDGPRQATNVSEYFLFFFVLYLNLAKTTKAFYVNTCIHVANHLKSD